MTPPPPPGERAQSNVEAEAAPGLLDLPRTSANARLTLFLGRCSHILECAHFVICVSIATHFINGCVSCTHFPPFKATHTFVMTSGQTAGILNAVVHCFEINAIAS